VLPSLVAEDSDLGGGGMRTVGVRDLSTVRRPCSTSWSAVSSIRAPKHRRTSATLGGGADGAPALREFAIPRSWPGQ
jgi:hypothetical protein